MTRSSRKRDINPSVSRATGVEKPKSTRRDPASFTSRAKGNAPQCVAIKRNGERCKAAPIRGASVCRSHGGAAGHVKKKAKERLLELVDPALAELQRILTNPKSDDHVKVRAALGILDRTGFQRGVNISVETRSWDEAVAESIDLDRDLTALGAADERVELEQRAYNAVQLARDARDEAWAESGYPEEDAPPDHPYRDGRTVPGEVVGDSIIPAPPRNKRPSDYGGDYIRRPAWEQRDPEDPPAYEGRYVDEEVRAAEGQRPSSPRRRR